MKNVSPIKEKIRLHWRIVGCFFVVIFSFYITRVFFKEIDSHLVSLGAFIAYSIIIYKFFGGYTQHYKDE